MYQRAGEIKEQAKKMLKGNIRIFMIVEFLHLLLCIVLSNHIFFCVEQHSKIGISLLFNILFFIVLRPVYDYSIYYMMAKCAKNQQIKIGDALEGIKQWKKLIGIPYDRINYFTLEANPEWSVSEARNDTEKLLEGNEALLKELRKTLQYWLIPSFFTLALPMLLVHPYIVACELVFYQEIKTGQ